MKHVTKWMPHPWRADGGRGVAGWIRAAGVVSVLGVTGCFATVEGEGDVEAEVPVVEAEVTPIEITTYPHYYYRGEVVYLVEGRWYARRGPRWVMYRREPRELSRYRVQYERARPRRVYR